MAKPLTQAQQELIDYLKMVKTLRYTWGKPAGVHYNGMEDFLLEHGQWFEPRPWTGEYGEGTIKRCFANSIALGVTDRLRYIEGIALSVIPVHHAWNADSDGNLIDSTWKNEGLAYFGVEFSIGRAKDAIWYTGDTTILDDWKRRHPLYKQPWPGEDHSLVWKRERRAKA
jgi:hypothetical protein